jgi:hypothetical protein
MTDNEHIIVSKEVKDRLKGLKGDRTWNDYLGSMEKAIVNPEEVRNTVCRADEILAELRKRPVQVPFTPVRSGVSLDTHVLDFEREVGQKLAVEKFIPPLMNEFARWAMVWWQNKLKEG